MVQRLSAEHETKLSAVYEEHRQELEKLRESLCTTHSAQLEELRQKHHREVDDLAAKHIATLKQAQDGCQKQMSEKQKAAVDSLMNEHTREIQSLRDQYERARRSEVDELARQYDSERQKGLRELQDVRTAAADREEKNMAMWTDRFSKMQAELFAVRDRCVQQESQFKAALAEKENLMHADQKDIVGRHARE
eukprot:5625465-Amphidinium_carterae.1